MTNPVPGFSREDFESLLEEHQRLVALANEVEFYLHVLAGGSKEDTLQALQQSTGSLVSGLRTYLFRQDQQVLPLIDRLSQREESTS